jgi:hypothetical protein
LTFGGDSCLPRRPGSIVDGGVEVRVGGCATIYLFRFRGCCFAEAKGSTTGLRAGVTDEEFRVSSIKVSMITSCEVLRIVLNGNYVLLGRNSVRERVFPRSSLCGFSYRHRTLVRFVVESA